MKGCARNQQVFAPRAVAEAVEQACRMELGVMKPGNVSVYGGGQGKNVEDFVRSAVAMAPELSRPGASVGERILYAIRATRQAVSCNTNLGIVLLCAPLAHAALRLDHGQTLRHSLRSTLRNLDRHDARLCYEAIRIASPGGLGMVSQHDVAEEEPGIDLLQAMATAAVRDRIAQQYVTDFSDVFDVALPRLLAAAEQSRSIEQATLTTYLYLLGEMPDTHIEREHGKREAESVCSRAKQLYASLEAQQLQIDRLFSRLSEFDKELKQKSINPGTTADLTVAALMVLNLQDRQDTAGPLLVNGSESAQFADLAFI